jgi:hypothetical protein
VTKHTPGPWQFNGPEIYAPNFRGVREHHYDVARVLHVMDDEGEANALLIAAAPDLLSACKRAVHLYDHDDATSVLEWVNSPEFRAAIAKAEGGAE